MTNTMELLKQADQEQKEAVYAMVEVMVPLTPKARRWCVEYITALVKESEE